MSADSSDLSRGTPTPRLERPRIISSTALRTSYSKPVIRFIRGVEVKFASAIEIIVATDRPIPATAITPVLFVGDIEIADFETTEDGSYRFFAFEPEALQDGAPISLGWPGERAKAQRGGHRYEIVGDASR